MFRRNRRTILTIAGLALFTFAAIGLFSSLTWHSTALENEAANRSNIHRQNAHSRIEWVCPTAISQPDCIAEANQTARENEREEQDLAAQKITAWWTKIMGIAAMIGMALSAVGVWLVKTTFDETRRSNEIAESAATDAAKDAALSRLALIQTERAVVPVLAAGQYPTPDDNPERIQILFTVKNLGKSNAHGFTFYFNVSEKLVFKQPFAHHRVENKICVPGPAMEFDKIPVRKPKNYPSYVVGYLEYSTLANAVFKSFFAYEIKGPIHDDGYSGAVNSALTAVYCETLPSNT